MKKIFVLALLGILMILPQNANAWGMLGHRVVGEIASRYLTPKAQKEVKRVLGNRSMATVSNWMDDIKSDHQEKYDTLSAYHWVSVPDGMKYEETNRNPKGDCVIGLDVCITQLKSGTLSLEDEEYYLQMLIHIVGDMHQPLHVGRSDDKGGNTINVSWFGSKSNLHKIWDSDIINGKLYSYTEITDIIDHPTPEQIKMWQASTVDDWIQECQDLRPIIYDFEEKRHWEYEYMYNTWDIMLNQLLKGGIRLAGILNDIYR